MDYKANWRMFFRIMLMCLRCERFDLIRGAIVAMADMKPPEFYPKGWKWGDKDEQELKGGNAMQAHQERVVDEYKDLKIKREKLGAFLANLPVVVEPAERERLQRQFDIMVQYEGILCERIDNFR